MSLSTSTPSFGSSLNRRARRFFSELSHPILAVSTKRYQVHALAPSWSNLCPCSCPPSLPKRAATSKPCHGECSWPRLNPKLCPGIVWDNATWLRSKRDHSKVDDRIPVGGNLLGHGLIYYDMPSLSYCYDWNRVNLQNMIPCIPRCIWECLGVFHRHKFIVSQHRQN